MTPYYAYADNPFGTLLLVGDANALTGCYFVGQKYEETPAPHWRHAPEHDIFQRTAQQLRDYANGALRDFDIPLAFAEGTPFQQRVWREIAAIPFGQTITYGELARRAGSPGSARAAGAATGRNPISVIVPCHRVLGSNGSLTGYAGGLERKKAFLTLEGVLRENNGGQIEMGYA